MSAITHTRDTVALEGALPEIEKWGSRRNRAATSCKLFLLAVIPTIVLSLRYQVGTLALILLVLACIAGAFVSAFVWELSRLMVETHITVLEKKLKP